MRQVTDIDTYRVTGIDGDEMVPPALELFYNTRGDYGMESLLAQDFVSGAYTICPVSEETVAATDAYIAANDPPAALHRLLIEGRDEVLRCLRCQARDREG